MNILIGDFFMNRFFYGGTGDQKLNFFPDIQVRLLNELPDNLIAAGIGPVRCGQCLRIGGQRIHIIQDAPWVEDLFISEKISVIPVTDDRKGCASAIICCHPFYFRRGKAEIFSIIFTEDGIYF